MRICEEVAQAGSTGLHAHEPQGQEVNKAAGLRDELSFTSFRHGGFTESGDAELTDRELLAQGRHTTPKVLPKYVKRTTRQIMTGTKKRRAARTKDGHLSE
jgi:hypothetical protein